VLDYAHDETLRQHLIDCKREHEQLKEEIQTLLDKFHDEGKEPNPMAKGMSWVKTNAKLVMHESDQTIADLITDGCNMVVKSLNKYIYCSVINFLHSAANNFPSRLSIFANKSYAPS
ncbi:hypothetical protein, partial [Parabacteroides sp.]